MTDRARELEPCPFCRHAVPAVSDGNNGLYFRVICGNGSCRAAGPLQLCAADAVSAWNTRALTPPEGDTVSEGVVATKLSDEQIDAIYDRIDKMGAKYSRTAIRVIGNAAIAALQSRVSPQEGLREALEDCVATLAAVRATAAGDDWANSAAHFSEVCLTSIKTANAALSASRMSEDAK